MNSLAKFKIATTYSNRHQTEEYINDIFGQNVVWEYDDEQHICFCNILLSLDDDFGEVSTIGLSKLNLLGNNVDCTYVGTLDLPLNGSSRIERLGSVGGNENINQIRQIIEVPEGNGIRTYIFTVVFNNLTGEVTTSNTSTYRDTYVEEITTTTTDPETGETTSTTTTTNSQTGDETTSSTTYNENGTMTGSSTHTNYGDGGSYDSEQTYNDNGTIASDSNTTTNNDGSSESHSTNYDNNGNPTDGENQWIDTSGNENTQSVEYNESGDPEIVGYEINTTGNQSGNGETIDSGLDTGVLAFDGRDFDVYMKCKVNVRNYTTSHLNPVINMSSRINNKVNGLCMFFSSSNTQMFFNLVNNQYISDDGTKVRYRCMVTKYLNNVASGSIYLREKSHTSSGNYNAAITMTNTTDVPIWIKIENRSNVFTVKLFNPFNTNPANDFAESNKICQGSDTQNFGSNEFADVTVEIGHWSNLSTEEYYSDVQVLMFNVQKL
jgi:hypothetical protein